MASEYCRQILRVVVAQLCQHLGWHSTHATPLEVLTDVLERYILDVSRTTHQYAERYGRTEVNLDDLGLAFRTLDISLSELDDYVKHVEALPFGKDLAAFPKPKKSNFGFPNPKSREIYHREEHVSDYLPYMFPGMEDEMEVEEEVSPTPSVPAASQPGSTTPVSVPANQELGTPENLADTSPALKGEKRALNSPSDGAPNYKRQRLSNNNLPEEAGHSQYEMTSIRMSVAGLLTPIKSQGKLPDPTPPVMFIPIEKKKEPPPPKEIIKKTEPAKDINTSKIEDKENITTKKPKENDPCKKNIPVKGSGKIVSKTSASSSSGKPLKKNLIGKAKVTKVVKKGNMKTAAVSVKSTKSKMISKTTSKIPAVKTQPTKGATKPPILKDVKSFDASGSESRLKELLLDPKVEKATKVERKLEKPSPLLKKPTEAGHKPWSNLAMPKNHPEMLPKNVHLVADDSSSSDESPEPRLVIAESDPKPKDKKSAEMASKYDSIISSAIRRAGMKSLELAHLPLVGPKEKKKPVARKKKKEPMEKIEKSTLETIDACINSVMCKMRATYELEKQKEFQEALVRERIAADAMLAAATASSSSNNAVSDMVNNLSPFSSINPSPSRIPAPQKTDRKEDKKLDKKLEKKRRNLMKEKTKKLKMKALKRKGKENAKVQQKLTEKLKSKPQRPNSSGSEKTPAVRPDNFTADEWKIYDFDGSPRGSYSNSPHELDSSPFSSSSPHSIRSCVSPSMDSLTLLSTAAAAAASNVPLHFPLSMPVSRPPASVSSQDSDIPSQLKMKIGLAKGGKNKKVKSKDKEHKKDKKDKKKDKEKKKKNKEKEEKKQKERAKEENYQCVVVPQADEISTPLSVPRLKLNIKFGGSLPVAVTPDADSSKKTPAPMPAADRMPLNTPTNIKQDIPPSPLSHRPEIPRLVIRTPVPVKSPPAVPMKVEKPTAVPMKVEKPTAKVTKPTPSPKAKATPKKTPIVKKPVVKKEKPTKVKKSAKYVLPEPINVPSICKIEALNAPPQIPHVLSNVSAVKHLEIGNDNIADKLMSEATFVGVKTDKFSPTKSFPKSQKVSAAMREKLTPKEKQMLLKGQILPVSPEFGLRQAEENSGLKAGKVIQGKTKTPKAAKPAAKLTGKKLEKVFVKGKSEKATAKAKAEKSKAEKVALEMAATALAKVEKPILIKDKPIIKMNRPPNKLGRPPKNPQLSPPPTIPYPSSPPCIPASIGGMLPIAQPIGHHHFSPNLANIPTPVPKIPRPSPVTPKSVPTVVKVAAVAKTVSAPRGRGGRSGAMTKAQKLASAKLLMPPAKESDLYITCPANLLTPMPLTSPPALPEKLMSLPNKSSPISSPLSSSLHMIGGLPPDNSLIALPRDIVSANMPMDSSSFNIHIDGMTGSSENPMSLGKRPVQRSVFAETVGTFMDENGQKIWICPGCKLPDDGSPMIGCDGCDDWYHWPCVNIREEPPSEEQWFCQKCLLKTKNKPKRKRRRKTKTY